MMGLPWRHGHPWSPGSVEQAVAYDGVAMEIMGWSGMKGDALGAPGLPSPSPTPATRPQVPGGLWPWRVQWPPRLHLRV